jgi:replicative DNA helicase
MFKVDYNNTLENTIDRQKALEEVKGKFADYLRSKGIPLDKHFKCINHADTEKSPNMHFYINDNNEQRVKCFSCNFSVDFVGYIQKEYNLSTEGEAIKKLYDMYNIQVSKSQKTTPQEQKEVKLINNTTKKENATETKIEPLNNELSTDIVPSEIIATFDTVAYKTKPDKNIEAPKIKNRIKQMGENQPKKYTLDQIEQKLLQGYTIYPASISAEKHWEQQQLFFIDIDNTIVYKGEDNKIHKENILSSDKRHITADQVLDYCKNINMMPTLVYNTMNYSDQQHKFRVVYALPEPETNIDKAKNVINTLLDIFAPFNPDQTPKNVSTFFYGGINTYYKGNEAYKSDFIINKLPYAQEEQKRLKEKQAYINNNCTYNHIDNFLNGIKQSVNTPPQPTGFKELDNILDGGLYEGLYFIGAISSLGKTTFLLQIADQIAKTGKDILIFSLEMSRNELIAKSMSRETALNDIKTAKTVRGITNSSNWACYDTNTKQKIAEAMKNYEAYSKNIYIFEGLADIDIGVKQVRELTELHIKHTGKTPIVIIDYLQILAPVDARATDKSNTDKAVKSLKIISRDLKTPVIAISSLNRENYANSISMLAFKESGAIEYSSDVLIGLQLKGTGQGIDIDIEKSKDPREIELKILKNRNGRTGEAIGYKYYPKFNYFVEDGIIQHQQQEKQEKPIRKKQKPLIEQLAELLDQKLDEVKI